MDASVYIYVNEYREVKIGKSILPGSRGLQYARYHKLDVMDLVWVGEPHPRAYQIEQGAHQALTRHRVKRTEMFRCSVERAKQAIRAATREQDAWCAANPEWLAQHKARKAAALERLQAYKVLDAKRWRERAAALSAAEAEAARQAMALVARLAEERSPIRALMLGLAPWAAENAHIVAAETARWHRTPNRNRERLL
jgi:hypothetical protein